MDTNDTAGTLLELLNTIAPDVDPKSVAPERAFRDQFDFDSMDALHFASAVSEAFHIEIAETDYPKLASLRSAMQYVDAKRAHKA